MQILQRKKDGPGVLILVLLELSLWELSEIIESEVSTELS